MDKSELHGHTVIVAVSNQVSSDLADEVVILDLKNGMYYGLDEVGARIWELIQQPRTIDEIRDALLEEYEVEPEDCTRDLVALLQDLNDAQLIEVRRNGTGP
jgi:coenzyme PQQ synthesis protein D (PqqD)